MLLRFLFALIFCLVIANANAQVDSALTLVNRKKSSNSYVIQKGYYCHCISDNGKSTEGVFVGADNSKIYIAQGIVVKNLSDTESFYERMKIDTIDAYGKQLLVVDTVSCNLSDINQIIAHPMRYERKNTKMDNFIDFLCQPATGHSTSFGAAFIGYVVAIPFAIVVFPTEYFIYSYHRKHSFDMRIWKMKN